MIDELATAHQLQHPAFCGTLQAHTCSSGLDAALSLGDRDRARAQPRCGAME